MLAANGQSILHLIPDHMILEHHLLLRFVHEQELVLPIGGSALAHGVWLSMQWQGYRVTKFIASELHSGRICTDDRSAIRSVIIGSGQVGAVQTIGDLVRPVHACRQLSIPSLHFVHFVVDIVVVIA